MGERLKASGLSRNSLVILRDWFCGEVYPAAATSDFRTLLDREAETHIRCGETADHAEGVAAFMEKREPHFQGR